MFEGLIFKEAVGSEREQALALQNRVYTDDLGQVPADPFDADAHFLIARTDCGEVLSVFRLVGPEQRPFDFEALVTLTEIIAPDRIPALVGRLCVRRDHRTVNKHMFIQIGMFKLAFAFAEKHGITDLFLYTYPNLIAFYRGGLFELVDRTFKHPDWGEVHLMHLDLVGLEARCAGSREALARLLFATDLPNLVV